MKARIIQLALLAFIVSGCRHSSYEFASSTVAQYGPELERVAMDLAACPAGSYVNGTEEYGRTGERCSVGANSNAVRSVLLKANVYWVVVGDARHATIFVVRDKRDFLFGPIGVIYYTPAPWPKNVIEETGHIPIGSCPCNWFYQDS